MECVVKQIEDIFGSQNVLDFVEYLIQYEKNSQQTIVKGKN